MLRMMANALRATIAGIWNLGVYTVNSIFGTIGSLLGGQGPSLPRANAPLSTEEMSSPQSDSVDMAAMQKLIPVEHLQKIMAYAGSEPSARSLKALDDLNRHTKAWVSTQNEDALKALSGMKAEAAMKAVFHGTLKMQKLAKDARQINRDPMRTPHSPSEKPREFTRPRRAGRYKGNENKDDAQVRVKRRTQQDIAPSAAFGL